MHQTTALVLLAVLSAAAPALADDVTSARAHYKRGTTLYDLGKYREAAREYEAAFEAKDDPALLFNIGQAYRLARDYDEAIRAYKSFLRRLPNSPNRPTVEARLRESQALLERRRESEPPIGPSAPAETTHAESPARTPVVTPSTAAVAPTKPAAKPAADRPLYKKWWLWTVVGGVVVAGAVVGITVGALSARDHFNPSLGKLGPSALSVSF
jgi:tetratricopeptide (TPR) repeat protein